MGLHSPLSSGLGDDITKASKILTSFLYPSELRYTNKCIPSDILETCKGIAIITIIKGGFMWSGRAGTGIVAARLADGSWSAPSAIGTAGVGFGGQVGGQITDFVMILNTDEAVKAFSRGGNITLGANIAVAAGPFGRSAEYGGSIREAAPIYSYSKSMGLFAGVSLEGSAILERKRANAKLYGRKVCARDILSGKVEPPKQAQALFDAIRQRLAQSKHYTPRSKSPKRQQATQIPQESNPSQDQYNQQPYSEKNQQSYVNLYKQGEMYKISDPVV